jgi:hypothetical protein
MSRITLCRMITSKVIFSANQQTDIQQNITQNYIHQNDNKLNNIIQNDIKHNNIHLNNHMPNDI